MMIKVLTTLLLALLSFFAGAQNIASFRFDKLINPSLAHNIVCTIYNDSEIVGLVPYNTEVNMLIPTFEADLGTVVTVDDIPQQSGVTMNDFSNPVVYKVNGATESKTYTVKVVYTGLTSVFIYTDNEESIDSKDIYVNGRVHIYPDETGGLKPFTDAMQIKGRGNTTWHMAKKPYKIKLSKKSSILGMAADKEWVLLANYSDKSLLRTAAAFETSKRLGMPYTPDGQSVDVFLNEKYEGTYFLTEQIKISSGRVNITEMKATDTDPEKITGGYLLEVDERLDEALWFRTTRNVPFTIKEPDLNPTQFDYIKQYVQEAEDALYGPQFTDPVSGYAAYLNVETFVNWYLVNELFKNNDASFYSSVFLFKDKNNKLSMGPVWDFDIAAGNIDYSHCMYSSSWWIRNSPWISRLFDDPAFKARVKSRWAEIKQLQLSTLDDYIENQALKLAVSQEYNFKKWDILGTYVWPNATVLGSYTAEVNYLKFWLNSRIDWMDQQLSPKPFYLTSPQNNRMVVLDAKIPAAVDFNWSTSNASMEYHFHLKFKGSDVPFIYSLSSNNGLNTSVSISSQTLLTLLQNSGYKPGDSVVFTWRVYAMLESDSVASANESEITLKLREELSPFNLRAPSNNELVNIPSNVGNLYFNWSSSKFAAAYNMFFSNDLGKIIHFAAGTNKGKDTLSVVSYRVLNNLLSQYGTAYGDSVVLNIRWTAYAYLTPTDSLRAHETSWLVLYRINQPPLPIPQTVNLTFPSDQAFISASANSSDKIRFSWKPDSNSTSLLYRLVCADAKVSFEESLFEFSTRDTFVEVNSRWLDSTLKNMGLKKGDSTKLMWTIYTYLDGETNFIEANQAFVLNCNRQRALSPFSITSPTGDPYIVHYVKDSFPVLAIQWQTAGTASAVYYKVRSLLLDSVIDHSLSNSNGTKPFIILGNASISQSINTDSALVQYHITAYDGDEDSMACSKPLSVLFILREKYSGVSENDASNYSLALYPNPVAHQLTIHVNKDKRYAIDMFDITGKSVYHSGEHSGSIQVPVKQLDNGIYFCTISVEGTQKTLKVIVAH